MSIVITYQNIEQLIFCNKELQDKLPEFKGLFNTWTFASKQSSLKLTAQKALLELLRKLGERHITVLKEHFGTEVSVEHMGVVYNFRLPLEEAETLLNTMPTVLKESYFVYRDESTLYVSMWR